MRVTVYSNCLKSNKTSIVLVLNENIFSNSKFIIKSFKIKLTLNFSYQTKNSTKYLCF